MRQWYNENNSQRYDDINQSLFGRTKNLLVFFKTLLCLIQEYSIFIGQFKKHTLVKRFQRNFFFGRQACTFLAELFYNLDQSQSTQKTNKGEEKSLHINHNFCAFGQFHGMMWNNDWVITKKFGKNCFFPDSICFGLVQLWDRRHIAVYLTLYKRWLIDNRDLLFKIQLFFKNH